ncbi:hypothetical protein FACS1894147_06760 [Spirochaetia bacterium]|nr:hypothetical protein FACS1894147_06760 [Spirochaetia bacterium]
MTFFLMHKSLPAAEIGIDDVTGGIFKIYEILRSEHLPLGIEKGTGNDAARSLNEWWVGRAIPASRSGLREALEILHISSPRLLLLKCFGLSLSDQYWVCPKNKALKWEDINFFENDFSEDVGNALFGKDIGGGAVSLSSPDNTSDGWLRKKWVIADGKRLLLKGGSTPAFQEPLNEVLASMIMEKLNIPHVPYTLAWDKEQPLSACEDFISPETDLISAWRIYSSQKKPNHFSIYQHTVHCMEALGIPGVTEGLDRMITVDFLIANTDRHFNNFGAVRNAETLEWLGMAPIFDCGTSMWHDQFTHMIRPGYKNPSKPFKKEHEEQIKLVTSFSWLDLSSLKGVEEEYGELLTHSIYIDDARRDRLCFALTSRIKLLEEFVKA